MKDDGKALGNASKDFAVDDDEESEGDEKTFAVPLYELFIHHNVAAILNPVSS